MKCFVLFFALVALLPLSVQADYIFEQSYEFEVGGWPNSGLDGGDFNNDGFPDFASSHYYDVTDFSFLNTFLGNGDCTFNTLQTSYDYILGSITVNDFNNDGYDDLLIGEGYGDYDAGNLYESEIVHRLAGNGDGTFTELDTLHVSNVWVTSGDLNDDGNCDLVTSSNDYYDFAVLVKLGNGDFTFQETVIYEIPWPIRHTVQILGDMDLDGNVDIGILSSWILFLYGNGDGTFQPAAVVAEHGAMCYCFIGVGDFNEDGMPDMAATGSIAIPTYDVVFVWDGIGTFIYDPVDTIGGGCYWLEVKDFDMDGHLDIAMSSIGYNGYVLPGYGDGTFSFDYLLKTVFDETYSVLSEDFDLDGDYDLVFCEDAYSQNRCIRCYRNTTITQGCEGESESSLTGMVLDVSPNPFFTSVSIEVTGYSDDSGNLQIFDLSGRLVAELEPVTSIGKSVFMWDGISSGGSDLPSGIYTARLSSGMNTTSVTLLKLE